jgi:Integrase core domain
MPVVASGCTARPSTRARSIGTASACCGHGSGERRGCPTNCRRWSSSGSWASRLVTRHMGRIGSQPSFAASGGARSPNGVWRVLKRHGLNTRSERLSLVAGYAAPYQPPRSPQPQPHILVERPGELVGIDCFFVGRLRGTTYPVWQITAIDCYSSYGWADLITCPTGQPTAKQTSRLAHRVAADLATCEWKLERVFSDNGNEFRASFDATLTDLGTRHTRIRPDAREQANVRRGQCDTVSCRPRSSLGAAPGREC